MGEDLVGEAVVIGEVISLWAEAEEGSGSKAKARARSKAADKSVRSTRAEAKAESRSKAADGSVRSTQAEAKAESRSKGADRSVRSTRAEAKSTLGEKLTCKQLGEIAEAEFIAKAVSEGFVVAKPWGDSESYDFIVNVRKKFNFWRVQVKSAHVLGKDLTYSFRAHDHAQKSYTAEDIDALVAYAKPDAAWYVFPVRVVEGLKSLKLYPGSRKKRSKYEKWRERWEVFRRAVRR
jgi:PD-(D/E)XK endonuclease